MVMMIVVVVVEQMSELMLKAFHWLDTVDR